MLINNITSIIEAYNYFILDIYGLIHDGDELFDGAIEMLHNIKNSGKKAIFLSNAPRRSYTTIKRLEKFGITDDLYDNLLTPGEVFYQDIKNNAIRFKKYFALGLPDDLEVINTNLNYIQVNSLRDADFILCLGVPENINQIPDLLTEAKSLNLKMICINPDKVVHKQGGKVILLCAGHIANEYEKLGGIVEYYGKPYPLIYEKVIPLFSNNVNKSEIIAIGDALATDILGANTAGINSCLVLTGLHHNHIQNSAINMDALNEEAQKYNAQPTFVLKNLL